MDKYLFVGRAFGDEGFVYLAEGLAFNQVSSYSNRFIYAGIFFFPCDLVLRRRLIPGKNIINLQQ